MADPLSAVPSDPIRALLSQLRLAHKPCDDCWYSCPKSEGGCCDERQSGCTCGADGHNAIVDQLEAALCSVPTKEPERQEEQILLSRVDRIPGVGHGDLPRRATE